MKLRSAAVTILALLAGVASLMGATPTFALTDFEGDLRYETGGANPYAAIEDARGNVYTGTFWGCDLRGGGSGSSGYTVVPSTTSGGEEICGDQPANYYYMNADGNDRSFIVIGGASAQSNYGIAANEGSPTGYFVAYRGGASVPAEKLHQVTIEGGVGAPRAHDFASIAYHPGAYSFLNDQYDTIIDSVSNISFRKIEGCVDFNPSSSTYGRVLEEDSPTCAGDNTTYFVYEDGSYLAALRFSAALPAVGTELSSATVPNATFYSFVNDVNIDRIEQARINQTSFASTENVDDFDARCVQQVGGLSWILCPIVNFAVDKVANPIQEIVLDLLETDPLLVAPATDNNSVYIYNAWAQFRSIANALLAVAFIVLIYLMLFTQNNAYSLQRTLPRLVVITILIQISYFIAAIMVDLGNVAAEGISAIFDSVRIRAIEATSSDFTLAGHETALPDSAGFLTDNIAARGLGASFGILLAVIGFTLWTWWVPGVIIFFAAGLMLSLLGVLIALVLRQLAIVVFVVLAPLAFIAGLFPSTEKWMREWFDNLGKLIFIYPLIALVFGAGSLLSYLAISTNQSEVNMLIGSSVGLIVLFTIPALFSLAGRFFKGFTGMVTNLTARSKSAAQGDANNPLSWKSSINFEKAQKQLRAYDRTGKILPYSRRFLRPSWREAQVYNAGAQRMQGVVSPTHPANLRRIYWGSKPFNSLAGYANWKDSEISSSNPFKYEIKNITKSPAMLYSTVDQALKDSGFLFDRALNYTWGIHRLHKDGEIDRDTAERLWGAFQSQIKGQGHRLFFGAANPSLLLDHDYRNPADLGHKWFADSLDDISNPNLRQAVATFRQSSTEDFGNAGTERETGASWRYEARWLNDRAFLDSLVQRGDSRYINSVRTLKRKADTMQAVLQDPQKRADIQARLDQMSDDQDVKVGGYGQSGQTIHHMEEFVKAANSAYNYMLSRGVHFTDEINEFNY